MPPSIQARELHATKHASARAVGPLSAVPPLTEEGHHGEATVLDLCCLQAEDLLSIVVTGQTQGVEEATCTHPQQHQTTTTTVSTRATWPCQLYQAHIWLSTLEKPRETQQQAFCDQFIQQQLQLLLLRQAGCCCFHHSCPCLRLKWHLAALHVRVTACATVCWQSRCSSMHTTKLWFHACPATSCAAMPAWLLEPTWVQALLWVQLGVPVDLSTTHQDGLNPHQLGDGERQGEACIGGAVQLHLTGLSPV